MRAALLAGYATLSRCAAAPPCCRWRHATQAADAVTSLFSPPLMRRRRATIYRH